MTTQWLVRLFVNPLLWSTTEIAKMLSLLVSPFVYWMTGSSLCESPFLKHHGNHKNVSLLMSSLVYWITGFQTSDMYFFWKQLCIFYELLSLILIKRTRNHRAHESTAEAQATQIPKLKTAAAKLARLRIHVRPTAWVSESKPRDRITRGKAELQEILVNQKY